MSQSRIHSSECFICRKSEASISKIPQTRNTKKDNWIQCDCCKSWFHATCGGYNSTQYSKICRDNIWIKCVVCCIQQVYLTETDDDTVSRINVVIDTAKNRNTGSASAKGGKNKVRKKLSQNSVEESCKVGESSNTTLNNSAVHKDAELQEVESITQRQVDISTNNITVAGCVSGHSHSKPIEVCNDSDLDKIVVIDNINNPAEFSSSQRILKEIHNFFPHMKIEFAYSLAKGGVAIHTSNTDDRDRLLQLLPAESFGGGLKHTPKGQCGKAVFIKGVDTSVNLCYITDILKQEGIKVIEARRLTRRYTGKPTQVVKVQCAEESVTQLLSSSLVVNNKRCVIEKERLVRVVRCFNCQSFGHLSQYCNNSRRCEQCGESHLYSVKCVRNVQCANCSGSHPASSSVCPVYAKRYADLAEQYSKRINLPYTSETSCVKTQC